MEPTTVVVSYEIPDDEIDSLLCSAVESGGIRDWAHVDSTASPEGSYRGMTVFEDLEPKRSCVLTDEVIVTGLRVMALKYPRHFKDVLAGNADMDTADVFVQCVVLGECVYG